MEIECFCFPLWISWFEMGFLQQVNLLSQVLGDGFSRTFHSVAHRENQLIHKTPSCPAATFPPLSGSLVLLDHVPVEGLGPWLSASGHSLILLVFLLVAGHRPWHCSAHCYLELSIPWLTPSPALWYSMWVQAHPPPLPGKPA